MYEAGCVGSGDVVGLETLKEATEFVAHSVLPCGFSRALDEFSVFRKGSGV